MRLAVVVEVFSIFHSNFVVGGYYMIERKTLKLQIVVLNTNLMKSKENDGEANRQWEWLDKMLQKIQLNKETVSEYKQIYGIKWIKRKRNGSERKKAKVYSFS